MRQFRIDSYKGNEECPLFLKITSSCKFPVNTKTQQEQRRNYTQIVHMIAKSWVTWCHSVAAKSLQTCPTLCNPIDGSPPGYPIPGILQARTLEWVAISFSNSWKWKLKVKSLSLVWLLATPWTAAYQAPPSRCFSRQEYWIGVPLPSQGWHDDFLTMSVFLCCWLLTSDKSCKTFGETIYDNLLLLGSSAFRPIRYFDYDVSVLVHQF